MSVSTITVTVGAHGTCDGSTGAVTDGTDKTYVFTPAEGYEVQAILVDGAFVTTADSYTFEDVQTTHTIVGQFQEVPAGIIGELVDVLADADADSDEYAAINACLVACSDFVNALDENIASVGDETEVLLTAFRSRLI